MGKYPQVRKKRWRALTVDASGANAAIVVGTNRRWYGDPRLGTFVVFVDGKKAGAVPPEGSLRIPCAAGSHRVSARQWWYRSRPYELVAAPGTTTRLEVDVIRRGSIPRRMLTLMFTPWRGVTIGPAAAEAA